MLRAFFPPKFKIGDKVKLKTTEELSLETIKRQYSEREFSDNEIREDLLHIPPYPLYTLRAWDELAQRGYEFTIEQVSSEWGDEDGECDFAIYSLYSPCPIPGLSSSVNPNKFTCLETWIKYASPHKKTTKRPSRPVLSFKGLPK